MLSSGRKNRCLFLNVFEFLTSVVHFEWYEEKLQRSVKGRECWNIKEKTSHRLKKNRRPNRLEHPCYWQIFYFYVFTFFPSLTAQRAHIKVQQLRLQVETFIFYEWP